MLYIQPNKYCQVIYLFISSNKREKIAQGNKKNKKNVKCTSDVKMCL